MRVPSCRKVEMNQSLWRIMVLVCFACVAEAEVTIQGLIGQRRTILCSVDGLAQDLSAEKITWQHDGASLFIDEARVKKLSKFALEITDLKYADSGLYSCHAKSTLLNSTILTVEGKPFFTDVFGPKAIFEGKELYLNCAAKSRPIATIRWENNGVLLTNKSGNINVTERIVGDTIRSEIRIESASYVDNGTYGCIASNLHGYKKHLAPIQIYVAVYIKNSPKHLYVVKKGSDVTLKCSAFGNPQPRVFWLSESVNTSNASRFKRDMQVNGFVTDISLKITGLTAKDSGNFTCIAVNSISSVNRAVALLHVQDVPNCCRIVTSDVGTRRIKLAWGVLSDGYSEVTKYNVALRSQFLEMNFIRKFTQSSIDIGGLSPNMKYAVHITAENAIGVSKSFQFKAATLTENYNSCLSARAKIVTSATVAIEWVRNCSIPLLSDEKYLDVIVTKKGSVINFNTYKRKKENRTTHIVGLTPFTQYGFRIRTIEPGRIKGFQSQILNILTKQAAPSRPRNVIAASIDSTSIAVSWDPPLTSNGVIKEYEVEYGYNEKDSVVHVSNKKSINVEISPKREFILNLLMMNTRYNISIRERTAIGLWSAKTTISFLTRQGVPLEAPRNVSMTLRNNSLVTLRWSNIPKDSVNGVLIGYVVSVEDISGHTVFNKTMAPNQTMIFIDSLKAHQQYEAKIYGFTQVGAGKEQLFIFFTADGVPSAPRELEVIGVSSQVLRLKWRRPQNTNGIITAYQINWNMLEGAFDRLRRSLTSTGGNIIRETPQDLTEIREHFIRNLTPYSIYSVQVREKTVSGWGPFTKKMDAATLEGESSAPLDLTVMSKTSNTIKFRWNAPRYPNGAIKVFTVNCYQDQSILKDSKNITVSKVVTTYKATCSNLKSNTETMIMVYAVSSIKGKANIITTNSAAPEDVFPWLPLIGGSVGFVVVVALIMTIVLLCRRKTKYIEVRETMEDVEMNGVLNSRPIHIANLKQYVLHNHTNSDHGFFTEYEAIKPAAGTLTWEHSQDQLNQSKNRYSNVVAYDHTRVVLSQIDNDPYTTYINANYIDGYKQPRKFIATQGPLPDTVNDFWRMVYEQGCHVIVMLTRIVEDYKVKCEEYWPDHATVQYGDIIVKLIEVTELSDYVVRTFSMKAAYDVEAVGREVKQYHYLGWPDHGVPEYPTSMVTFTKYVMDNAPPKPGPIVVHCSAGVGRTGTMIVIDAMLNQIRDENIVDVYKFVSAIRRQRNFMVQTESQYVFIYDALLDAVICGNTEATAHDISLKLRYLNQQSPDASETYLMQEFKRLEAGLSSQEKELFSVANLPENKEKNRFLNILPYNRNRVKLAFIYGQKGSDYINASYVDGYRQRHAFIATQGPLENTVSDFWRMIWEQNCHNIVMLTKLKEKGKERSRQYWPSCGSDSYGKFLVDELRERDDECDNVTRRELNLTYNETGRSRRLNHYLYTGWPEYGSPNSGTDIIKLISLVQVLTTARGSGPVIVHCSGGAGRTGTFIALCICIQKLKTEGTVDVFQTVRQLRTQRPAMVQTIDQYYFCYQALKDYVDMNADVSKSYDLDESLA